MRRIGFSFARGLERRPWRGELAQAISLARRFDASASYRRWSRSWRVEYNLAPDPTGDTPAGGITRLRHEVSGSIWVGANPPLASDRFGGRHAKGVTSVRAAPGPIRPGWPRLPKGSAEPPAIKSCEPGRPGTRCAGFGRFEVVLAGRCQIAEVDERRGAPISLGAKSALENHGEGLASPRESIGEAK